MFVVNEINRVVPTTAGWIHDGKDVHRLLDEVLVMQVHGKLDPGVVTQAVSDRTYWAVHQKKVDAVAKFSSVQP